MDFPLIHMHFFQLHLTHEDEELAESCFSLIQQYLTFRNLDDIGIPRSGSKLFLTTHRQQVYTLMESHRNIPPPLLSEEEAWLLLQKHARIEDHSASSLSYEVAREVAGECKGLPLAIEAVGASLRGKSVDEWKIALHRLKNSKLLDVEETMRDIFACLLLSYDYLTISLAKSLFLICGLFPEDHKICKEDLFRYALGLGFCGDGKSFEEARSCVNAGINELVDSCLLMHSEEGQDHVKMHRVVRDVALWVASRENCVIMVNVEEDLEAKAKESFAVSSWYEERHKLPDQLDAPKLEIFILHTKNSFELSNVSFEGLKVIKVMAIVSESFAQFSLPSLPQSTHLLMNLRVLRLVGWKLDDISSLVSLTGLEILDLHFSEFKKLPTEIVKLNKLRLLDISWCMIEEDCYEVLGRCSQLEELYAFAIIKHFGRLDSYDFFLDDANTFPKLERYALRIGQLYSDFLLVHYDITRRIVYVGELNTSTLGEIMKDLLQRAEEVGLENLSGGCKSIFPKMVQVIGGMDELTTLCLRSCSEIEYFINAASDQGDSLQIEAVIPKLVKLELIDMNSLKEVCHVPPCLASSTCNLNNLKTLEIIGCPMLTSLFPVSVAGTLVQLEELKVIKCPELKQMIINEGDGGEGTSSQVQEIPSLMFSKVKHLIIGNCDKLEFVLPISCVEGLVQLRDIQIHYCSELQYFFGQFGHDSHSSSENEIQVELPSVELLQLIDLPNLQSLFPENYHSRWPSLKILNCRGNPKLRTPHSELKQPHTITITYC